MNIGMHMSSTCKVHIASDLHTEHWSYDKSNWPEADVYVLAGDIATKNKELPEIETDKPVLLLSGNHEYYGHIWNERDAEVEKWLKKHRPNWHYMSPRKVFIHKETYTWFICTPLWSDCHHDSMAQWQYHAFLQRSISDFTKIRVREDDKELRFLHPMDYVLEYSKNREWVITQITNARLGGARKIIVVTHFSPGRAFNNDFFKSDKLQPYFCARMEDVIVGMEPDYWFYGHTHASHDSVMGKTRVISNPRGYPGKSYSGNPNFNPSLIIEV